MQPAPLQIIDILRFAATAPLARSQLARVHHTMRLEDQALRSEDLAAELERMIDAVLMARASRLWETP
jgi:hypothetical protein